VQIETKNLRQVHAGKVYFPAWSVFKTLTLISDGLPGYGFVP
jgi:hypothetical protein